MHIQGARGCGDISVIFCQHFLNVLQNALKACRVSQTAYNPGSALHGVWFRHDAFLLRASLTTYRSGYHKMKYGLFAALLGFMACQPVWAGPVLVSQAWVRTTVPGQEVAGAYMVITASQPARLIAVRSPVSRRAEVHAMQMDGSVMRMRFVRTLELPKNAPVHLEPGGYHIMLMNLKKPILDGERIPLTLTVETRGKREVLNVEAVARNPSSESGVTDPHVHH